MAEVVPSSIAIWKPFSGKGTTPLTHDIICVHTMVGSLAGSWSWANGAGRAYWHFGVSGLGECWQCQDLRFRSAANLNGNHRVIPIENADMGPGFGPWNGQCGNVPPFTQAQINKLIDLIEWLCRRYNIPPVLIPDTMPGRRGIAYHRQGISPWKCGACETWSSPGKCCPDDPRIQQLITIIIPEVARRIHGQPPIAREDKMYAFIMSAGWPAIYLTDGMTKRHMVSPEEHAGYLAWLQMGAQQHGVALWKNGATDAWPPDFVNRIPTVDPEDKEVQLIDFVRDPAGGGVFMVFGNEKILFPNTEAGQASLADFQNHWNARGYDTSVKDWAPNDIDIIPLVGTQEEPVPTPPS